MAEAPLVLDIDAIRRLLPHRAPFLFVERITDIVPFESANGWKAVGYNEPFFQGHFPEFPVMPGVLIVEAIAQTGGILMSKTLDIAVEGKTILFMSLDNVRFRTPVRPGDEMRMPVEVVRHRGDVFKFKGRAMVRDKLAAEVEFAAMVVETG